ncbi:unnamed protein product, partial [Porites lobata]
FKETLLIFVTLVVSIRSRPASNPHTPCIQVDESTKDLVSEMLLLVGNLSKDVTKSKKQINANWLVPKHSGTNYPIYITWSQRDGDNIQSRLKIDHCIVKSFVPLLHCAIEEFRNVSNSKGIVHKLKDLKWDSKKVIRHFQEARESLLLTVRMRRALTLMKRCTFCIPELDTKTDRQQDELWDKDQKYRLSDIQITTFVSSKNMKKTTSKLELSRQIVKAFISHLRKLRKQFSAFSDANNITHRLQRIEWIAKNVIYYIQEIQGAPKPRNTDTEVIRPTKITAIKNTSSSSSGMVTAQSSAATEQARVPVTSLQLDEIAVQASALLKDIDSKILDMRVDLKILVAGCTSRM